MSVPIQRQSSDGAMVNLDMRVVNDHKAQSSGSYQFDSRDSVTKTRSISSVSVDSNEEGHKRHHTGSSRDKSDHDKVYTVY